MELAITSSRAEKMHFASLQRPMVSSPWHKQSIVIRAVATIWERVCTTATWCRQAAETYGLLFGVTQSKHSLLGLHCSPLTHMPSVATMFAEIIVPLAVNIHTRRQNLAFVPTILVSQESMNLRRNLLAALHWQNTCPYNQQCISLQPVVERNALGC